MTTKSTLGRLERVNLRDCWEREDSDFTPWLASDENIALLGEAIGIELEVQQEEAAVGPFRADILCRNTATDELVIVENQLERTDHSHLGQILTYASGLDAVSVVWIAARFTEEHRAALDWLNRISHEGFSFFGIEIEVWRIGDSPPAPKFNIVAQPNDWSKTAKDAAGRRTSMTAGQEMQLAYWTAAAEYFDENRVRFRRPKPYPQAFMQWGLGRTGVTLIVFANVDEVLVGLDVHGGHHPTWFRKLRAQSEQIETELGFPLEWIHKPHQKYQLIRVRMPLDTRDSASWPRAFAWQVSKMDALDRAFRPRLKVLDDSPLTDEVDA